MNLLILGGSPLHLGGVEAFCERSEEALQSRGGWTVSRLPTHTAYLTVRRLPVFFGGLLAMARFRTRKIDCVWLQYVTLPDLVYLVFAQLLGFRIVVTPHLGANWKSQSKPVLRRLSTWMLGFANRIALISKTQEQEIELPRSVPRSMIRTFLPPGVLAPPESDLEARPDALQLIHCGRLSEGKGTFLFVEVCQRLRDAGVPFFARIAGHADEATLARLDGMIADRRLQDQISVLGLLPNTELLPVLRRCDVLVHLSRIDSYPLIVLESLACSVFPVCMDLAGAHDMIQTYDGQVVSDAEPVRETADFLAAESLQSLRDRSRAAAPRVRGDYDWATCAMVLEEMLLEP